MENEPTTKTPNPARPGFRNFALCTCLHPDPLGLIFASSTYLSCHEFIATEPPFLSMDYFSVFSAFSVAVSFVPLCLGGQDPRSTLVERALQIAPVYAKQSQIKANFKRSKPISNAEPAYPACRTRDCRRKRSLASDRFQAD